MKKEILIKPPGDVYLNNRWFTSPVMSTLKTKLTQMGFEVNTIDLGDIKKAARIIFFDSKRDKYFNACLKEKLNKRMILFMGEPPVVKPKLWLRQNHQYFWRIFTWADDLVDGKKYFKISFPQNTYKKDIKQSLFENRKFCVMVQGNKFSRHPLELYSERRKAISFFQKKCPGDFDLYGIGWNDFVSWNAISFFQKKFRMDLDLYRNGNNPFSRFERYFWYPKYKCYKGKVKDKIKKISKYKFCICYENMRDFNGFITEKIIDCFQAYCVPIYLGPKNITDYIPENTFIDKRNFLTYDNLLKHLQSIDRTTFEKYLENIKFFLKSKKGEEFFEEEFAKKFCELLFRDVHNKKKSRQANASL